MASVNLGRTPSGTVAAGKKRESLLLGYVLVGLLASGLGALGVLQESGRIPPASIAPLHGESGMVVTGDDMELTAKEEGLVWGANYLGVALLGPAVLALLMLLHIRNPLGLLVAVPLMAAAGLFLAYQLVRRWDGWIRRRI